MVQLLSQPTFNVGSGNPRLAAANDTGTKDHAKMLELLTGGKKRKTRGGAEAAQFNLQYNPGGQNPNTIVTKLQESQIQSAENAKLDGALVSGGAVAKGSRKKKNKTKTRKRRTATKRKSKRRTNRKKRR